MRTTTLYISLPLICCLGLSLLLAGPGDPTLPTPLPPDGEEYAVGLPASRHLLEDAPQPTNEDGERRSSIAPPAIACPATSWEVIVLGPRDVPIEGVWIKRSGDTHRPMTDAGGRLLVWRPEREESVRVELGGRVPGRSVTLVDDRTVIRFPDLPALEVQVINAETGVSLPESGVHAKLPGEVRLTLSRADGRYLLPFLPWKPQWGEDIDLEVDPPPGFVMEDPGALTVTGNLSRYTRVVSARVPAWPEADLKVLVTEQDGRPVAGAVVDRIWFKSDTRGVPSRTTDRSGIARVAAVPSIPGQPIRVFAGKDGRNEVSDPVLLETSREEVWAVVVLPPEPKEAWNYRGPSGYVSGSHREPRYLKPEGNGRLLVSVWRFCGLSAANTYVELYGPKTDEKRWRTTGRTGPDGVILFEHLPAGTATLRVRERGFLMAADQEIELHPGTTTTATIVEDRGKPVEVLVKDERGRPVAGAALEFHPHGAWYHAWMEGTVQRLGFFTDAGGRFTAPRMPAGKVRIYARLGSRRAGGVVAAGGTLELQLGVD